MESVEKRVIILEAHQESHDKRLNTLERTTNELKETLHGILATLSQIKWIAVGAGVVTLADELNLSVFLKLFAL